MKKTTLLTLLFVTSSIVKAQQLITKDQQAAQQTIVKMFDALSNRDSVALKTYCTTDVTFFEYGEIWDLDTLILKAITQNTSTDFKRSNTFDFISTKTNSASAWVTYRLTSEFIKDGQLTTKQWLETVVLAKEKKQWKVKHLHSTLLKKS
jgi:ketosteroid isomerase-like protein